MQAPRESYRSGVEPISRDLIHGCGQRVQVTVDEWGQIWEWCAQCRQESSITQQRPKTFRRYDQRERLQAEMTESLRIAKRPANPKLKTRRGGMLPINCRRSDDDDL